MKYWSTCTCILNNKDISLSYRLSEIISYKQLLHVHIHVFAMLWPIFTSTYLVWGKFWPSAHFISNMGSNDLISTSDKYVSYHFWLTVDTVDPVSYNKFTRMMLTSILASLHSATKSTKPLIKNWLVYEWPLPKDWWKFKFYLMWSVLTLQFLAIWPHCKHFQHWVQSYSVVFIISRSKR